ncbi:hypothetical protein ACQEU3_13770 [Spirillospora sp. CA-253888]
MEPSPEAIAWGKRQAANSPRWTSAKWTRVATIFEIVLTENAGVPDQSAIKDQDQAGESLRDAA